MVLVVVVGKDMGRASVLVLVLSAKNVEVQWLVVVVAGVWRWWNSAVNLSVWWW